MDEDMRRIAANVALALRVLAPLVDFEFGLDRRSLVWVEGFLERQRENPEVDTAQLIPVLGSFLGQCLVEQGNGRWTQTEHGWGMQVPGGDAFSFAKVTKQAENGLEGGDSIVAFYDYAIRHLDTADSRGARGTSPHADSPGPATMAAPPAVRNTLPDEAP